MIFQKIKTVVALSFSLLSINLVAQADCAAVPAFYSLEDAMKDPSKVVKLDLGMQTPKLTAIPKEVALFPNLECLDVSFNRVASIPNEIVNCKKLKTLILSGNRYLAKVPLILKEVKSLKKLELLGLPEWNAAKRKEAKTLLPAVNVITD
jgi:Leucine Rich repeats (2 copies)